MLPSQSEGTDYFTNSPACSMISIFYPKDVSKGRRLKDLDKKILDAIQLESKVKKKK